MGPGILDVLFNRLAWAVNACCDGLMPEHDWQGKQCPVIADGGRFGTIMLRGDWEFFTAMRVQLLGDWFGRTDWPLHDGGPLVGLMSNMSRSFLQME